MGSLGVVEIFFLVAVFVIAIPITAVVIVFAVRLWRRMDQLENRVDEISGKDADRSQE